MPPIPPPHNYKTQDWMVWLEQGNIQSVINAAPNTFCGIISWLVEISKLTNSDIAELANTTRSTAPQKIVERGASRSSIADSCKWLRSTVQRSARTSRLIGDKIG
jgi:hypothetical protein